MVQRDLVLFNGNGGPVGACPIELLETQGYRSHTASLLSLVSVI